MERKIGLCVGILALGAAIAMGQEPSPAALPEEQTMAFAIGGAGGAYFLAEPGELVVELSKRDRNRRVRRMEVRAILVGPDQRVLQEVTIPDDGLATKGVLGPVQRARLSTKVDRPGIYGLNITLSQDRYGEDVVWGFRTNCRRWVIETARGHKDERHQEPIVLMNPGRAGDVSFLPRPGPMGIEVTGLPETVKALELYDAAGQRAAELPAADGRAEARLVVEATPGDAPWRLHLPEQQATVNIDGVTRWDDRQPWSALCIWSPDPATYFPLRKYRWLVTPYNRTIHGQPGQAGRTTFQVLNNADAPRRLRLGLEFPKEPWEATLSASEVTLAAGQLQAIELRYTVPAEGESRSCHLRATVAEEPAVSTYATLEVRGGAAPAEQPLSLPLTLQPYRHENQQFGYLPDYPTDNQVYFDPANRPFIFVPGGLASWQDADWAVTALGLSGDRRPDPGRRAAGMLSTKVAFDREGGVYLLASAGGGPALMVSRDHGRSFTAYPLPGPRGSFDMEQFSGHNDPQGPPPLVRYRQTAADPQRIWRRIHEVELILPKQSADKIEFGEPILLSRQGIGFSDHSGCPSSVVSRGDRVHVAWGEATDPAEKIPGVPVYAATYDRKSGRLTAPALITHGAPANDVHNTPSITMDSEGYLHVLGGTHGRPFPYARSLQPNDTGSGWSQAVPTSEAALSQTYIGLVCGPDDSLHAAFRLWKSGEEPFPSSQFATLAYQRKPKGKPWEPARIVVLPAFSEYSVYYHRLTIDRRGRLFLSYDYWSTYWFYRNSHFGNRRALMMSPDGGTTWQLVAAADLVSQSPP